MVRRPAAASSPTHALFAAQSHSIVDNLVALLRYRRALNCSPAELHASSPDQSVHSRFLVASGHAFMAPLLLNVPHSGPIYQSRCSAPSSMRRPSCSCISAMRSRQTTVRSHSSRDGCHRHRAADIKNSPSSNRRGLLVSLPKRGWAAIKSQPAICLAETICPANCRHQLISLLLDPKGGEPKQQLPCSARLG